VTPLSGRWAGEHQYAMAIVDLSEGFLLVHQVSLVITSFSD